MLNASEESVSQKTDVVNSNIEKTDSEDYVYSRKSTNSAYLEAIKRGDMETAQKIQRIQ